MKINTIINTINNNKNIYCDENKLNTKEIKIYTNKNEIGEKYLIQLKNTHMYNSIFLVLKSI